MLYNDSWKALSLAMLMLVFSMMPQDYKVLKKVFSSIGELVCSDDKSADSATKAKETDSTNNLPTIIEEELFHHHEPLFTIHITYKINPYSFENEYCKGIAPDTSLPPPDRWL